MVDHGPHGGIRASGTLDIASSNLMMGGSLVKELNRERAKAKCFCAYLTISLILDLTLVRGGVFFKMNGLW
jgi:hypothetical protein